MDQSYRGKRTLREGRSFEEPVLQYTRNTSLGAIHLRVGVVETRVKRTAFLPLPTRYSFYFVYAFLKLLLTRKLKKQTLLLLYFIYFLALFYLLFLKNIGTQGLSLNPLSFARELYWGSHFVPIMNLLMFIPLGLLFSSRLSNLLLCLLTLFSVESIQYFGHLGVFDLGDITLNMLGILVGTAIHQLPQFQTVIKKILS